MFVYLFLYFLFPFYSSFSLAKCSLFNGVLQTGPRVECSVHIPFCFCFEILSFCVLYRMGVAYFGFVYLNALWSFYHFLSFMMFTDFSFSYLSTHRGLHIRLNPGIRISTFFSISPVRSSISVFLPAIPNRKHLLICNMVNCFSVPLFFFSSPLSCSLYTPGYVYAGNYN